MSASLECTSVHEARCASLELTEVREAQRASLERTFARQEIPWCRGKSGALVMCVNFREPDYVIEGANIAIVIDIDSGPFIDVLRANTFMPIRAEILMQFAQEMMRAKQFANRYHYADRARDILNLRVNIGPFRDAANRVHNALTSSQFESRADAIGRYIVKILREYETDRHSDDSLALTFWRNDGARDSYEFDYVHFARDSVRIVRDHYCTRTTEDINALSSKQSSGAALTKREKIMAAVLHIADEFSHSDSISGQHAASLIQYCEDLHISDLHGMDLLQYIMGTFDLRIDPVDGDVSRGYTLVNLA